MSSQQIVDLLAPVLARLKTLDLANARAARQTLNREFPAKGELLTSLFRLGAAGLAEGWLCGREAGASKFSRVAKPEAASGYSVDAVLLWGEGPWHKHTRGEVNCLLPVEGKPKFCGIDPPWAVFEPGSQHVPAVTSGKMLIFYMLPEGAMEWNRT